ncbi:hypothetical protein AVEN_227860-1 [Araneus ventricosus]|uniref:Tc1-like transposase DDE domain-containing protein n=1 Tax=Araneus ventricosus TaxID=182803 RepID=A0A4Y2L777_ARAVE|nr:hypothetical protein AVEN_227860-1 [Araneus ventricosus]
MRILKRDRCTILPQIAADFSDGASTSVRVRTVQRTSLIWALRAQGPPTRVPLLTALHKALFLSWARQHYHWTADDCTQVTWSNESRFQLYRRDARVRQDNTTLHASRVATKWLQKHSSDFRHFQWPPKSSEMNIIEDIRDAFLHAVEKRSPPPRTPMDLLTALQDSWCEFPPGYLQTPVESLPRRFASLLRARGARHDIKKVYQFFWLFSV